MTAEMQKPCFPQSTSQYPAHTHTLSAAAQVGAVYPPPTPTPFTSKAVEAVLWPHYASLHQRLCVSQKLAAAIGWSHTPCTDMRTPSQTIKPAARGVVCETQALWGRGDGGRQ